jgi:alkanesulfonate monooxygenase SsuD/methylene tetrahydromethanopterin reductase-like flavin-dependent oxidoreductase (luciferase family)
MSVSASLPARGGTVVLGTAVRTLGAFPSGWRVEGAHRDPAGDPQALKRLAKEAERAHLDYLFFGDWLSSNLDLEFTDPYLLGRIDPLSAAGFLASSTNRIGLVATVNTSYSDPFTIARSAASIDHLSGGRFGLNLAVGAEPRADANHAPSSPGANRHDVAAEYLAVLNGLWDSWADDAVVADAGGGALIDRSKIAPLDHEGRHFRVAGPALGLRPVQGHVPIVHSDVSPRAREFAAEHAELHVVSPSGLGEGVELVREIHTAVAAHGRDADSVTVVVPLLPIVAETREAAWQLYDRLVELVPVDEGAGHRRNDGLPGLPPHRTAAAIRRFVGVPLLDRELGDPVSLGDAERFNPAGGRLLETVRRRSGRTPGGARPTDYRQLLVAHLFPAPLVVGSASDVADHIETWFRAGAADGFTVQSAYLHEQFEAFTRQVVPILVERGLFRADYETKTLRGHLGSARPEWAPAPALPISPGPASSPAPASDRASRVASTVSAFDGVVGLRAT